MSITCQLCNTTFEKFISGKHLKYKHGITGAEYKNKFGEQSLCTLEFRESRRATSVGINKGKIPHNKGQKVTDPIQLAKIREAIQKREQTYKSTGYHPRQGKTLSAEARAKIGNSVSRYACDNAAELKTRAAKAQQTLRDRGFDFGSRMRGKRHNQETLSRMKQARIQGINARQAKSLELMKEAINQADLHLLSVEQEKLLLECRKCNNQFGITRQYFTPSKWRESVCPLCRPEKVKSGAELAVLEFVRSVLPDTVVISGDKQTIPPLELDILVPSKNIAIEYCGLYWHSELQGKHKLYHRYKMLNCQAKGIRLVTIFEDEWTSNADLVKSRLNVILGITEKKIAARKCVVKEIDTQTARTFCQVNHIQGSGSASAAVGLYYNNTLVSVATFSKPNISKGGKSTAGTWELNRMCTLNGYVVQGGANKMFKLFQQTYSPTKVITYCDLRWNTGTVYANMGFQLTSQGFPNYWYVKLPELKRYHRFHLRKNSNDNPQLTEWENRQAQGYDRIWDCGHSKWVWTNKKAEQ